MWRLEDMSHLWKSETKSKMSQTLLSNEPFNTHRWSGNETNQIQVAIVIPILPTVCHVKLKYVPQEVASSCAGGSGREHHRYPPGPSLF